ncbi:biotin--[acetyl-CoA-carboxylase] ligase [Rugosimonospora acidiphila]|uniref:biotin--[biotin carboxyl-carrier protein] ligase n=1 Tax=Rugosimonospora acidiphila TaxID=556531 RepID=A0ABP9RRM5_9ACTN
MSSPYARLDRPPLSAAALRRALVRPGGLWSALEVVDRTESTNADVARAAREGAAEGLVVVAEQQTAGRGRLGRRWESPPRAGLAVSVLLRPGPAVPGARYGWLPLLAGVALAASVRRLGEVDALLKWPNDLLIDDRKCAGILAEAGSDGAVVVGMGLNVTLSSDELPREDAISLTLAGSACTDRDPLLRAVLRELADWYGLWREAAGDADACGLRDAYRAACATLGTPVRVMLPGSATLTGTASDVDGDGRLLVIDDEQKVTAVASGDIVHLR